MSTHAQSDAIPVLMVDDRPENLLSLEVLLDNQGYELVRATSGNEALRLILKQDFALVLLDVQMPDMDGFETAALMRANPKTAHIPIIFVTAGMKDLQFQFKGYDAGAVDYLAKPIEPLFLQSKVKIFAELFRQRRELEQHRNHLEELVEQRTAELRRSSAELQASNEKLVRANAALTATEELLRGQVVEFIETHDQLVATEEMLRVQIEEYKITQQLLNESNISLKALFDVSPLAIVVSSFPDGTIREVNHTFSDDFGYAYEDVIGNNATGIGLWADPDERTHFMEQVREQGSVAGFAAEINTFRHESRSVLLYSNLMDFKGEACLLTVFLDVTEQKRTEAELRQAQKMDVVGQLAGGVAHDFNNMLTAIIGSAEMMERHTKENPALAKLLATIQEAAGRSADLTGQLLAFSRKGGQKNVQIWINQTIPSVIALLERTLDKNIRLETRLTAGNDMVVGDPAQIQNALLNLGINARDAMPDGGTITFATATVFLDATFCGSHGSSVQPGHYVEISVSDSGTGIPRNVMEHIFEPFFTTKEIGKGTGLGLAAVYGTVKEHRGSITVQSEQGIGTVFKLYLPLSDNSNITALQHDDLIHGSGGVLLVDDEEMLRNVGQAILEDLGYTVFLAEDGEQALAVYGREKNNISVVVLDMLMPRMGGRETLMRLMEQHPDVRVIVSSGFHNEGTVDELTKLGACGFLPKPYLRHELGRAVVKAMKDTGG